MNIEKVLEKLGYKRKEAQVYLATLLLGESRVSDIAIKVKMARTSVVVIIEKLHRAGLISYYWKKCQRLWMAENPERLLSKLREEEATLQAIMPELQALRLLGANNKPSVKIFTGTKEIKHIFEDIISTRKHFCGMVAWRDLVEVLGEEYMEDFFARQNTHFLNVRLLTPENEATQDLKAKDAGQLRETRFLPGHVPLNTANFMYGNKLAIISLSSVYPTAFLIEDMDIHNTMLHVFEKLWKGEI